ncbi:ABC transporter ATP-binding protein [Roseovarius tibetensis]|uniref:ABC transporter ATP-binding protein n=1 Tax=Roseovarius tibetensis TaxID=2685897 RepID=UPI003D7FC2FA
MTELRVENLSVQLRGRPVLGDVNLTVEPRECIGLIGPNGAGKTTLLRAILGLVPHAGHSSLAALSPDARGRACAWMPQSRDIAWPVSVETLVALGRTPHLRGLKSLTDADRRHVDAALTTMGLDALRHRAATRLSGGEQAMALIARALAQDTPLLMADEPIAGLDPANQISTMQVFADLARDGRAVIVSMHDLGLAARHCTRLILLGEGGVAADGPPAEVLTPGNLARIFHVSAHYAQTAQGPVFQPMDVTR